MYPINYKFVKPEIIEQLKDGETKQLTVLVLDTESNDEYWKMLYSFEEQLKQLDIQKSDDVVAWLISSALWGHPAIVDAILHDGNPDHISIYGVPIKWVDDERPFIALELPNQRIEVNELW